MTFLAAQALRGTIVGFYDSMGPDAVEYCLRQTLMPTMFASEEYLAKIISMREDGKASTI